MQHDLSSMTLPALQALQWRVEKALSEYEGRKKAQAIRAIIEAAGQHGYSLTDLFGAAAVNKLQQEPKRRAAAPQKYSNPENRDQTWSGRGRKPLWVVAALRAGKTLDDLRG
jgi:DNA-binding protein H-NS